MNLHKVDPLRDPRWGDLLERHPAASVFHTAAWSSALRQTYGYDPIVYTTCSPDEDLTNGIPLSAVRSLLTGRRLVSMPFADHCEPLVDSPEAAAALKNGLQTSVAGKWNYVELRPRTLGWQDYAPVAATTTFRFHELDLTPPAEQIFSGLHASSLQRKIRRAEREGLVHHEGRSEALLREFYRLTLLTRRRHRVPPQPFGWFRNLAGSFGDRLNIRVAYSGGTAIGSVLTLRHRQTLVYKYGCSDASSHKLGAMPFLFWKTILDAKAAGVTVLDLGRSDTDNHGLITFKQRLGGRESTLTYVRYSETTPRPFQHPSRMVTRLLGRLPGPLFRAAGAVLYRHLG
jgi:hypothetical protein